MSQEHELAFTLAIIVTLAKIHQMFVDEAIRAWREEQEKISAK